MKLLTQTPYVAIMLRTSAKTYREVLHGILQHVRTATPWAIRVDMSSEKKSEQARLGYKEEKFSGVVIDETNDLFPKLDTFGNVPIVTIESVRPPAHLPKNRIYLYCDNNAIGNMAASFLISKGFKSFGYVNQALGLAWSMERGKAFASALRKAGFPCAIYNSPNPKTPDVIVQDRPFLAKWLRELPKPIALFAANDIRSLDVLDACRQEDIRARRHRLAQLRRRRAPLRNSQPFAVVDQILNRGCRTPCSRDPRPPYKRQQVASTQGAPRTLWSHVRDGETIQRIGQAQ